MAARDVCRMNSSNKVSTGRLSSSGHDQSVAAGHAMFSDVLTSCLKNATAQAANTGSLDLSKLTAVSFAAMRLEIGSWQFIAKTKDAVSATCCYGRRQLSWQVAEAGQKNKIELQWDDITNLRVTPMGPATELLEVDVQSTPALYQESSPAVWQRCHDFTGGEASCLRTQKVLFPAHTVMNLLQDLVLREPRLAAKVTANHQPVVRTGSGFYPGSVVGSTSYPSLPCLQTSAAGVMPSFCHSAAPQSAQLPLYPNMYLAPNSPFSNGKVQTEGLSRGSSIMSNLSCATAQPQLSSECLSSTNSEGSILNGCLSSSPCYQSSYTSSYINPFQAPHSPRLTPVTSPLGDSALLEQTAAMMKAATAALQTLKSPPQLYHSPARQQPTQPVTSSYLPQHAQQACFAPHAMQAVPVQTSPPRNFVAVQTAPSVSSIGMQALEELMMSDSSQDSSPYTASTALHTVQSAPASFYQAWGCTPLPCPSQQDPAQTQHETAAQRSMSQVFENITESAQHDATPTPAAAPALLKSRALKRSVSHITVFDCKAAAAAVAAKEAAKSELATVAEATQAAEQQAELAELDLPLIDDYFLADMGSSEMDSDLTSSLCFDAFADFQQACPGLDRSDSSSNLLADQALQFPAGEALAAPTRKGKQSKKLKARGGVTKASA